MESILYEKLDFLGDNKAWWNLELNLYDQIYLESTFSFVAGGASLVAAARIYHKDLTKKFNIEYGRNK